MEFIKWQDRKPRMPILQGLPKFLYTCWLYLGAYDINDAVKILSIDIKVNIKKIVKRQEKWSKTIT